jgi:hypothetical protein
MTTDQATGFQTSAETKNSLSSSLSSVLDQLRGPPSLLSNGYPESFPWGKTLLGRHADRLPHLVSRPRMIKSYPLCPSLLTALWQRDIFTLTKEDKVDVHAALTGEMRNVQNIVGKPEGKRLLVRSSRTRTWDVC